MLKRPSICDEVVGLLPAFENKPLELIVSPTGVMRNGMMVFSDDKQKQTDDWRIFKRHWTKKMVATKKKKIIPKYKTLISSS